VEGWTEATGASAIEVAKSYEAYEPAAIIYTNIQRDGMQSGVDIESTRELAQSVRIPIIASGGVAGIEDIGCLKAIERFGVIGVVVGKALYTGALSLEEAIKEARGTGNSGKGVSS
jgi:phosphoribosylformimino-5-aminoimidazole carboxamide ribotide isomerase